MFSQAKERYEAFLKEKNPLTDLLTALEHKTGVHKQYLASGKRSKVKRKGPRRRDLLTLQVTHVSNQREA